LLWTSEAKEKKLDSVTVDEWLTGLGQSAENKTYLWDTIAIGSLNDHPKKVSALLFFRVLRAAFMGTRDDSCLLIPKVGLSELFVDTAVTFIENRGGELRTGTRVHTMVTEDDTVRNVQTALGDIIDAEWYVQAVPYFDISLMLRDDFTVPHVSHFVSTPIVSINLWFERRVFEKKFAAVLNSNIQWIFNRSDLCQTAAKVSEGRQHLSLVISGAEDFVEYDKESIVQLALTDLARLLPSVNETTLLHSLVIKEKRATFSPRPGMNSIRPSTKTKIRNLFLAGDWTDTGLPATIEGAVMSGRKAAEAVAGIQLPAVGG
jgi:squalene-associated FAD-dependent desaturase